jgi:hypothetical protein
MRGDRYAEFGLTEADEPFRRAFRDGFRNSGLDHSQFLAALRWYAEKGQHLGGDATRLAQSFGEFAQSAGWNATHIVAAQGVYNSIRGQGPATLTDAPSPERDQETIEYATKLLQTEPDRYWSDAELQELQLEAIERQQSAPQAPSAVDHYAIERGIAQRDIAKFEAMMRDPQEAQKYWRSPELQAQFRDAITRSTQEAPVIEQPAPVSAPTESAPAAPPPAEPRPAAA